MRPERDCEIVAWTPYFATPSSRALSFTLESSLTPYLVAKESPTTSRYINFCPAPLAAKGERLPGRLPKPLNRYLTRRGLGASPRLSASGAPPLAVRVPDGGRPSVRFTSTRVRQQS